MLFFKVTQHFCRSVFPNYFITRQVQGLKSLRLNLRNLRPNLYQLSSLRNFTSVKNTETGRKAKSVILEGSKVPKKNLTTTIFKELMQKKFIGISKKPKDPSISQSATSWKDIWMVIQNNWKQILGISILTDILLAFAMNKFSEYRVNSALENGTQPKKKVQDNQFIFRPQISAILNNIFQPDEDYSYYHVVCGEHGTGKTTLIRDEAKKVGKGIIYVDIPFNFENLGKAFGKAINLSFFEDISITILLLRRFFSGMGVINESSISLYQWRRVMKIFRRVSEVYKKKNHKPSVIIYDNISRIVKKNPKILDILQDDAKDNSDNRVYIAVFISSEGNVLRRMQSRSSWSRAKQPTEIGDLTEKESLDYLANKRKIKTEKDGKIDITKAKRIYELVGGRMLDLNFVADEFLKKKDFEDIKKELFIKVENKFRTAKLLENDEYYKVGKCVIKALLDSKKLNRIAYEKFFKNREEANKVLESNVFTYHPEKNAVTFQSQLVECYIRENPDIFLK